MTSQTLGENYTDGLRAPYYANGRLLAAEDLAASEDALLARIAHLGEAAGYGVVRGLVVRQSGNDLEVTPGIGLSRNGSLVRLAGDQAVRLSLTTIPDSNSTLVGGDGSFSDCKAQPPDGGALVNPGAYLLTAMPTARFEGSVPVKAPDGTSIAPCASRWQRDGVLFRAIPLAGAPVWNASNRPRYRNLLAHWCFGSDKLKELPALPFTFSAEFGGLDTLSPADLTPCDLPLAVFVWQGGKLELVDLWSARRRLTLPYPSDSFTALIGDRRVADAQARFLQFQDEFAALAQASGSALEKVKVVDHFRYLPPVGFLPAIPPHAVIDRLCAEAIDADAQRAGITLTAADRAKLMKELMDKVMSSLVKSGCVDLETFFGGRMPNRIGLIDRETVEFTLNRAWWDEAIDLSPSGDTPFEIYIVADTLVHAIDNMVQQKPVFPGILTLPIFTGVFQPQPSFVPPSISLFDFGFDVTAQLAATQPAAQPAAAGLAAAGVFEQPAASMVVSHAIVNMAAAAAPSSAASATLLISQLANTIPRQYAMFVKSVKPIRWIGRG